MILVDTVQEYMDMRRSFGLDVAEQESYVRGKVHFILDVLYDGDGLIREHLSDDKSYTRLLDRHINPGHTLEDAWFLLEFLEEYGELDKYLPVLRKYRKAHLPLGMGREIRRPAFGLWIGRAARPGVTASAHRMRSW